MKKALANRNANLSWARVNDGQDWEITPVLNASGELRYDGDGWWAATSINGKTGGTVDSGP